MSTFSTRYARWQRASAKKGEADDEFDTYLRKSHQGIYYLHWTEDRIGKRVSTRTKDPTRAKAFLAAWLLRDQTPLAPTLADVWAVYVEKHVRVRVANVYLTEIIWKNLGAHFGKMSSSSLNQTTADHYIARRTGGRLGRKVRAQTASKEVSYLAAAVRFCADDRRAILPPSFVHAITMPLPSLPRDRWLRRAEITALLAAAERLRLAKGGASAQRLSRLERFIWLALETAARREALLDLTWCQVDFELKLIDLNVPGRPQTKKKRAVVPISDALLPILERAFAERIDKQGDGLVMDNGGAIWPQFQRAAIEAGMSDRRKPKPGTKPKATGISPHVLRHTAASMMARRGVPLWIIAKILGNSLAMVERVYAKFQPDDLRDAINKISGPH